MRHNEFFCISESKCTYEVYLFLFFLNLYLFLFFSFFSFSSSIYLDNIWKEKEKHIRLLHSTDSLDAWIMHINRKKKKQLRVTPTWYTCLFPSINVLSGCKKKKKKNICHWYGSKRNINLKLYLICINSVRVRKKKCSNNCWPS